jgi:hypothetical protein
VNQVSRLGKPTHVGGTNTGIRGTGRIARLAAYHSALGSIVVRQNRKGIAVPVPARKQRAPVVRPHVGRKTQLLQKSIGVA